MPLTIGVPRETAAGEKRVATVPEVVEKLIKLGFAVPSNPAPAMPRISDDAYRTAGADRRRAASLVVVVGHHLQGTRAVERQKSA
jgi:NAD(P) transhydrogenase subunit alpha